MDKVQILLAPLKRGLTLLVALATCLMLLGALAFFALKQHGVISVPILKTLCQYLLEKQVPLLESEIARASLEVTQDNRIVLRLQDIQLKNTNFKATLPGVAFTINIKKLLDSNRIHMLESVALHSNIVVEFCDNGNKKRKKEQEINYIKLVKSFLNDNQTEFNFLSELLPKLQFKVNLLGDEVNISIPKLNIITQDQAKSSALETAGDLQIDEVLMPFSFKLQEEGADFAVTAHIQNIIPQLFYLNDKSDIADALQIDLVMSGQVTESGLSNINFHNTQHSGYIAKKSSLKKDVIFKDIALAGVVNLKSGAIEGGLAIETQDAVLRGSFQNHKKKLSGHLAVTALPLQNFLDYWPNTFLPQAYKWLQACLRGGRVESINAEFDLDTNNFSEIKKDAIKVKINIADNEMRYMPSPVPIVTIKKGEVIVSPEDVEVRLHEAYILKSKTTDFVGSIKYKEEQNVLALLGSVAGPVQDLIDLGFAHAGTINQKLQNFHGQAVTTVQMQIPLKQSFVLDKTNTSISAVVRDLNVERLGHFFTLEKGKFQVHLLGSMLNIKGGGFLNKAFAMTCDASSDILQRGLDVSASIASDSEKLLQHGIIERDWLKGPINTQLDLKIFDDHYELKSNTDLAQLEIRHPIGINKSSQEPGELVFNVAGRFDEKLQRISLYNLVLPLFQASGSGVLDRDYGIVRLVSEANSNQNEVAIDYRKTENGDVKLSVDVDKVDLSKIHMVQLLKRGANRGGSLEFKARARAMVLHQGHILFGPKLELKCVAGKCNNFIFSGRFYDDSLINVFFSYPIISITTDSVEKTMQAFGLNGIAGGKLELKGNVNADGDMQGRLLMQDYVLTETSTLAKILATLSSLQGFGDLRGKGLSFNSFATNIIFMKNKIYADHFLMSGPSLSISGSGLLDTKDSKVAVEGLIVPTNIINLATKHLPIIGRILSGNKNGGMIAVNFSAYGDMPDIKLVINPLSILAPGFLGEIFDKEKRFRKQAGFPN